MIKIVIVEDRLERGIELAKQFAEWSEEYPEYEVEVAAICYYCADFEVAETKIENVTEIDVPIVHITLLNFIKVMDGYLQSEDNPVFLIMDYMLDGDASDGTPERRVNIRYARKKKRYETNR